MAEPEFPALKDMFNAARYRRIAADTAAVYPRFDTKKFLSLSLPGLDDCNLLQRMRRVSEGLRATLPPDYAKALAILRKLAPRTEPGFISLFLPDFVGLYGLDHFDLSLDALKFFTPFGSSEFGIRPFLRQDLRRALKVMEAWSREENEHVRRLASEGCRPRLPWSFRLNALIDDPSPTAKILETLKADPSLYVRKSVANHLNDITKDHPAWVLDRIERWDLENAHTAWIVKRALRSLIKAGDQRALAMIGAGNAAEGRTRAFTISPRRLCLGARVELSFEFVSTARAPQKLVVDYAIHYVKKSGGSSAKVFKWKELQVAPGEAVSLRKSQVVKDFTTRKHHPGSHRVEVMVNGAVFAAGEFLLESGL
jgi:3-methyladenine DNA glycosylase AlkC